MQREYKELGSSGTEIQRSTPYKMLTRPFDLISRWFLRFGVNLRSKLQSAPQSTRVLDACCGYGVGAATLAREYDHLHVTGVDMYTDKELTEQIIESTLPGNVSLISMDVCNMSIESSTVDICYSMAGVAYIPDALLFLKELHRVLRTGGVSFLYLIRGSKDISTNITLDQLMSNVSGFDFNVYNMNISDVNSKKPQPYYKDGIVLEMLKTETDFSTDYTVKRYANTMSVIGRPMEKFYISAVYG